MSQPNKPHRKHQDGFQRSGRRQKRAAPPTVSPSDTGPPAVGPPAAGPPAAGPPAAGPPAAGPPAAGPPAAGPRILAPLSAGPPAAGPHIVTPPSARPRIMAPPVVRMFMRERQLPQSTGRKPQCFWEMRAGREITQMQQEPSSHLQSATQPTTPRPSWAPSVCALSVMDAGKAQPIESSHLSSMSPTQPISHEEQPRYEDPDAPLDLSLHPDVAAQPAPQAPYQGYQEPPAPQAPYQGYQEPPPPQAPYQGYQEPPAHGLQSSSYPGYAGPWTPRSQHPCYRHPWAPWSQDPVHGGLHTRDTRSRRPPGSNHLHIQDMRVPGPQDLNIHVIGTPGHHGLKIPCMGTPRVHGIQGHHISHLSGMDLQDMARIRSPSSHICNRRQAHHVFNFHWCHWSHPLHHHGHLPSPEPPYAPFQQDSHLP